MRKAVLAALLLLLPCVVPGVDRPRARDLGIPFDGVPGPSNAITDVPGVEVGLVTLVRDAPRAGGSPVAVCPFVAFGRQALEVAVENGALGDSLPEHWRGYSRGDRGADAVCAVIERVLAHQEQGRGLG